MSINFSESIICPYCGMDNPLIKIDLNDYANIEVISCDECGRDFNCHPMVEINFTTSKLNNTTVD